MALNANKVKAPANPDRVIQKDIPAATYPGRIVQVIDLGLQAQRPYQGKEKNPVNEIMLTYELVDEFCLDKDGKELEDKPRWISETIALFSLSQEKAKSTQRYLAADPQNLLDGDFSKLVGFPVNVVLVHNKSGEKTYVNVAGISAMRQRDADKLTELKNPPKTFDLDDPNIEVFKSLPDWIQEKIKKNLNYNGSKLQAALGGKPEVVKKEEVDEPPAAVENQGLPWD